MFGYPKERVIEVYIRPEGRKPFEEWFASIRDEKLIGIIGERLARVCAGNFGDSRYVGQGVFELRIDHGPGYRIYYGHGPENKIVILYGGEKKRQNRDIIKAQNLWKEAKV